MKKYLAMTANEAIRYLLMNENVPAGMAGETLRMLSVAMSRHYPTVSLSMPTHRAKPDYEKDVIVLKNMIEQAEKRLYELVDKRTVWTVMDNIREAEAGNDYSRNLDSLVLYANEEFSTLIKLPVELTENISIAEGPDLRPLIRTRQQNRRYYIITVSQNKIRLIEAFNDTVQREVEEGDFPFLVNSLYRLPRQKLAAASFVENMEKEFYNDADKSFMQLYNLNPMPVVLMGDVKSVAYYEERMDCPDIVVGRVGGNWDNAPLHAIAEAASGQMDLFRQSMQHGYLDAIDASASAGLLSEDINDIYRAAVAGAAGILYIGNSYSPGPDAEGSFIYDWNGDSVPTSDVVNTLIRAVASGGGQTVLLDDGLLEQYHGMVLARRFEVVVA